MSHIASDRALEWYKIISLKMPYAMTALYDCISQEIDPKKQSQHGLQ